MVPPSWIQDGLKMYEIFDKVIKFIEKIMKKVIGSFENLSKKRSYRNER